MKELFICEKHHQVLLPWSMIRKKNKNLMLLTFDHHTDVHEAFVNYIYYNYENHDGDYEDNLNKIINSIDYKNSTSIMNAIKKLRNDEQIDTAIKLKLIKNAFVISYDGKFDNPVSNECDEIFKDTEKKLKYFVGEITLSKKQTYPKSDIYILGTSEYLNENNSVSDDFIIEMLKKIKVMSNIDISNEDFILDIDLDYFHTYDSINGNNLNEFKKLLSKAYAITIATEPDFVAEEIDVETLLKKIIDLAKKENNDLKIYDLRNQF